MTLAELKELALAAMTMDPMSPTYITYEASTRPAEVLLLIERLERAEAKLAEVEKN